VGGARDTRERPHPQNGPQGEEAAASRRPADEEGDEHHLELHSGQNASDAPDGCQMGGSAPRFIRSCHSRDHAGSAGRGSLTTVFSVVLECRR
jgi:hypothetical protein